MFLIRPEAIALPLLRLSVNGFDKTDKTKL